MVSVRASDIGPAGCERRTIHPECRSLQTDRPGASLESAASCHTFLRRHVAVQLAEQGIAILLGPVSQVLNEVLDLLACGVTQSSHSAEIDGIGLHQIGVEFMLADELAEAIANGAATVAVAIGGRLRKFLCFCRNRFRMSIEGTNLFHRANADPVGLPQSAVDGARFGHTHLGAVYEERNVRGIRITVPNEAATCS